MRYVTIRQILEEIPQHRENIRASDTATWVRIPALPVIFLQLSSWTAEKLNPSIAYAMDFADAVCDKGLSQELQTNEI